MMNVPFVPESVCNGGLGKEIAERRGGDLLSLDKVLLHSEPFARGWNSFFGAIRSSSLEVSPLLRETAIMFVAVLNDAPYEWKQHEKPFLAAGGTEEMLKELRTAHFSVMSEEQLVVLALTQEMTKFVKVSDETMAKAKQTFSNRSLVEILGTIAGYNCVSRFLVATGLADSN